MCDRKTVRVALVLLSALTPAACATHTAPPGWLSEPVEAQTEAYGGWVSVSCEPAAPDCSVSGELIAVEKDSVYVLTRTRLHAIPVEHIDQAVLTAYDANTSDLSVWGALGTISTASHGLLAIISAPVWIVSSTFAVAAQSHAPRVSYPQRPLDTLRLYARFPQGLPQGLNRRALAPKPPR